MLYYTCSMKLNTKEQRMKRADTVVYYVGDVKYTISTKTVGPKKGWYANWTSKHLGRSESAVAKYTGRFNHA